MKKLWYKAAVIAIALGLFTACSDDNPTTPDGPETPELPDNPDNPDPQEPITKGAYIINTGNWNENNGSIQWYDMQNGTISEDLFAKANGYGIGDAQDLCVYGSKIYITCTSSAKIEILNKKDFTIAKTLSLKNESNQPISPRYMTAAEGNVYFTAQDGTVSRLDTTSLSVNGKITIGGYPEALTNANGKLYVNLSDYNYDGTGKQMAVIDIASFTKTKELEVVLNPYDTCLTGEDGKVYFISTGHSNGNPPSTLQCINPKTDEVTEICPASQIAINGHKIYLIYAEYYLPANTKRISVYDMETKETKEFISYSDISNPSFIAVDTISGDVFIGNQPYSALNDIYIYGSDGAFKKKIETGYYTTGMRFVME